MVALSLATGTVALADEPPDATAVDALVSVGSRPDVAPQNNQDEPAVAVDAHRPNVLAAGANDTVDFAPCPQSTATELGVCAVRFAGGIGLSGVYFSFDSGRTWTQPTYTGTTGYDCTDGDACPSHIGPIHTLPWYTEAGLFTWGDPGIAFGPAPGEDGFSWANGSRLYYSTLTIKSEGGAFPNTGPTFKGDSAIAVSRLDDATPERVAQKSSWMRPVIVSSRNNVTTFSDKEQIWADNAESSPYFGNVYVCWGQYQSVGGFVPSIDVATSRNGGDTWRVQQVTGNSREKLGCTLRTDSQGVVYLMYWQFSSWAPEAVISQILQKSYDGGRTWTRPKPVVPTGFGCFERDITFDCIIDGPAGARMFGFMPSLDIANGAPSGADATNELVLAWSEEGFGLNNERALLTWSTDAGKSWHEPTPVSLDGDRPMYTAPAISPDGKQLYLVYMALMAPWRDDFDSPRPLHGVFLTAPLTDDGSPGEWTTLYAGPAGDVRGSFPGHDIYQERVGDYVYAAATRTYGVGLWTDVRDAAVCDAVQDYREASYLAGQRVFPAPWPLAECDPLWGNADIWAATTG